MNLDSQHVARAIAFLDCSGNNSLSVSENDLLSESEQNIVNDFRSRLANLKRSGSLEALFKKISKLHFDAQNDLELQHQIDLLLAITLIGVDKTYSENLMTYMNTHFDFFVFFSDIMQSYCLAVEEFGGSGQ